MRQEIVSRLKRHGIPSPAQVVLTVDAASPAEAFMICLAVTTFASFGLIAELRYSDFNPSDHTVHVARARNSCDLWEPYCVEVDQSTWDMLQEHRGKSRRKADDELVFSNEEGGHLPSEYLDAVLTRIFDRLDWPHTCPEGECYRFDSVHLRRFALAERLGWAPPAQEPAYGLA